MGSRGPTVALISRSAGAALIVRAIAETIGLFLVAHSFVTPSAGTVSLWNARLIGLVLGTAGLSFRRSSDARG